jgi:choline dehydrogenase-like flavoprotein
MNYDFIIVGSGAGGATLSKELAKKGKTVLVVESGNNVFPLPFVLEKSIEGTDIFTAYGGGGATVLSNANGVRSLEKPLAEFGIYLDKEYSELEKETGLAPIHDSLLSPNGSIRLLEICKKAGIGMRKMPKFIDHTKCIRCGNCSLGCPSGAKWTALSFLREAEALGAKIVYNTKVEKVIVQNGKAKGVECLSPKGLVKYFSNTVVLSAGGIKTPVILQNSGIKNAGQNLFIDICEFYYGITPEIDLLHEPPMQLVNTEFLEKEGFMHSTGSLKDKSKLKYYLKDKVDAYMNSNLFVVIVKIRDEALGKIYPDGTFSKAATTQDRKRLDKGGEAARVLLMAAGAKPDTIQKREGVYGGHNGATAALGVVVDNNLQTKIENLFVCDGSILPESPGLPPMLTIMAIAKWFGKRCC